MYKLGFIGCGNMATAIIGGVVSSNYVEPNDICVFDVDAEKSNTLNEQYGVEVLNSVEEIAKNSRAVVLAVKPQIFATVLPQIKDSLSENNTALISIGAGKTISYICSFLESNTPVVRVMPNINAKVGASMSAVCHNEKATYALIDFVKGMCQSFGDVIELPESQFSIFGVIAACSPAYTFMFIDSMARGAEQNGMAREDALKISAQAVLGSAKMLLASDKTPDELIDSVCSPGGTTIEGITTMRNEKLDEIMIKAVQASFDKDKKL